jgi:hypothetical protein
VRVRQIVPTVWLVDSDSGNTYTVFWNSRTRSFVCTCVHFATRARRCKHIRAVEAIFSGREMVHEMG